MLITSPGSSGERVVWEVEVDAYLVKGELVREPMGRGGLSVEAVVG